MNISEGITFSIDKSLYKRKSSLKNRDCTATRDPLNDYSNNQKTVIWDVKSLEEQGFDKKLSQKKKINENKTTYIPYEEGKDEYWNKLNQINQMQPSKEFLEQLAQEIEQKGELQRRDSQGSNKSKKKDTSEDDIEMEVIDMRSKEHNEEREISMNTDDEVKSEFIQKSVACSNKEYCIIKDYSDENTKEEEFLNADETLKNTLYNKFAGQVGK